MSNTNSSLALEEIKSSEKKHFDLLPLRHLSVSNASAIDSQPCVVKVKGSITVSF